MCMTGTTERQQARTYLIMSFVQSLSVLLPILFFTHSITQTLEHYKISHLKVGNVSNVFPCPQVYFWTSSPSLPASEEGFQPMPSITIRPPDDQHLPTANTCISRLYVPLYSSKQILKQKLLLAIKTKNFGFV